MDPIPEPQPAPKERPPGHKPHHKKTDLKKPYSKIPETNEPEPTDPVPDPKPAPKEPLPGVKTDLPEPFSKIPQTKEPEPMDPVPHPKPALKELPELEPIRHPHKYCTTNANDNIREVKITKMMPKKEILTYYTMQSVKRIVKQRVMKPQMETAYKFRNQTETLNEY